MKIPKPIKSNVYLHFLALGALFDLICNQQR